MVRYNPIKRKEKRFGSKKYYDFGSYKNPAIPEREAKRLRGEGWNARVVKEGKGYTIYRRQTDRTPRRSVESANHWERRRK